MYVLFILTWYNEFKYNGLVSRKIIEDMPRQIKDKVLSVYKMAMFETTPTNTFFKEVLVEVDAHLDDETITRNMFKQVDSIILNLKNRMEYLDNTYPDIFTETYKDIDELHDVVSNIKYLEGGSLKSIRDLTFEKFLNGNHNEVWSPSLFNVLNEEDVKLLITDFGDHTMNNIIGRVLVGDRRNLQKQIASLTEYRDSLLSNSNSMLGTEFLLLHPGTTTYPQYIKLYDLFHDMVNR